MEQLSGLGKMERERLSAVLRGSKGTIEVRETASILRTSDSAAAKILARWAAKGWLSRVRRGIYVPVPLDSKTANIALEDPWLVAQRLYSPCYVGGWSAAEYWDLSEQIFRTIVVMTTQRPRLRTVTMKGSDYLLRTIPAKNLFGLKPVWRGKVKVNVSDPTRTILDMLSDPHLGGGIRTVVDMLTSYLNSKEKDLGLLINYAERLGNGAVFKRLGFILERVSPNDQKALEECWERLTKGNSKLDPSLPSERLITAWRLWVPKNWAKGKRIDR